MRHILVLKHLKTVLGALYGGRREYIAGAAAPSFCNTFYILSARHRMKFNILSFLKFIQNWLLALSCSCAYARVPLAANAFHMARSRGELRK